MAEIWPKILIIMWFIFIIDDQKKFQSYMWKFKISGNMDSGILFL